MALPSDAPQITIPPTAQQTAVTPTTIVAQAASAPAGQALMCAPGDYDDLTITTNNGTVDNRILILPQDPDNPPRFRRIEADGGNAIYAGLLFDDRALSGTDTRCFKIIGDNISWWYCDGAAHHLLFACETRTESGTDIFGIHAFAQNSGGGAGEAFKVGRSAGQNVSGHNTRLQWCKVENFVRESEAISGKRGFTLYSRIDIRFSVSGRGNFFLRHSNGCTVDQVNAPKFNIFGVDHVLRNLTGNVVLSDGSRDGDDLYPGAGSLYNATERALLQNVNGRVDVGIPAFSAATGFDARDNDVSGVTGTFNDDGINTGVAPTIATAFFPQIDDADVGINAYKQVIQQATDPPPVSGIVTIFADRKKFMHTRIAQRQYRNVPTTPGGTGDGNFMQIPTGLTTHGVVATPATIANIARTVPAGTLVPVAAGNYNNIDIEVTNGTAAQPVVFVPEDKNTEVCFSGLTEFYGSHGQMFGFCFDQTPGSSNRLIKMRGTDWVLAYPHFKPDGIAVALEQSNVRRITIHRARFDSPMAASGGGSTGKAAVKYGGFGTPPNVSSEIDLESIIEWSLIQGPWGQREGPMSNKARGMIMRDCHCINNEATDRDLAVRHGRNNLIERVRYDGGDIVINGTDNIIRNVDCNNVILSKGTDDGDLVLDDTSQFYYSAKRNTVQQVRGRLIIGGDNGVPFGGSQFDVAPRDNAFSNVSNGVEDFGVNTAAAPTIAVEASPILTVNDVGLPAYRNNVTGAP